MQMSWVGALEFFAAGGKRAVVSINQFSRVLCVDSPEFVTSSIIFEIILEVIWLAFKLMDLGFENCYSGGKCSIG